MGDDRRRRARPINFPASDLRLGGGVVSDHPGRHLRRRSLPATISSVTITPASTRPAVIAPIQPRPTSRSTAIATARTTRYRRVRGRDCAAMAVVPGSSPVLQSWQSR